MIKKVATNSFVLALINIFAIIFSFGLYKMLFSNLTQITTRALAACTVTILGFVVWGFITAKFFRKTFIGRGYHLAWVFLVSFLWTPIIFVPIHYLTQGYITSGDNLLSIWLFQIPTNILTLYIYYKILIQRAFI